MSERTQMAIVGELTGVRTVTIGSLCARARAVRVRAEADPAHEGVAIERVHDATGWDLKVAEAPRLTPPPTDDELSALRNLISR